MLLILGVGVVADVVRRGLFGSEPQGQLMMLFSLASLVVNVTVLRMLGRFRYGEVHLRAAWRETRADVLANVGVFASGLSVWFAGLRMTDLLMGLAIGLYVCKEAIEILRDAGQPEAGERRSFG
jgi:Co/Zn/Cd efflux system component